MRAHCLVSFVLHGALLVALGACQPSAADAADATPAPAAPEVATVVVGTSQVPRERELPGRLAATRVAQVRAQVSGIVLERVFEEGSDVKKGDVLFRIDPAVYRAEVDEREAALDRAEATRTQAQRQARRTETLHERQTVTAVQHDLAVAALKQADAEVAAARARLARAKIDLGHATVRAPIAGRIGRALVTEGALVGGAEATHMATIQQIDPIYADFTQSLADEASDLRDASAEVRLVHADGTQHGDVGRLLFTDVNVDPSTAQVGHRAAFPNPDGALLPGTYVRVRLARGRDREAVVVPPQAIQRSSAGEAQAFVVDPTGTVALRPLRTGPLTDAGWVVEEGLVSGETLVVEGFQKIQPGASVTPVPWVVSPSAPKI